MCDLRTREVAAEVHGVVRRILDDAKRTNDPTLLDVARKVMSTMPPGFGERLAEELEEAMRKMC